TSGLWRPPDLQLALNWRDTQNPTATWAVQYDPAFERAMVFLDTSESEFKKEEENKIRLQRRRLRVTRMFSLILGGIAVVAMGLFLWTRDLQSQAEAQRITAEEQAALAREREIEAQAEREAADAARKEAEDASQEALTQSQIAEERRKEAESASQLAEKRRKEAEKSAQAAREAEELARQNEENARAAQSEALENAKLAEQRRMLSIAQSMAVKSAQMRTDTLLKGILAYQAYAFNNEYGGLKYDPDIFSAIYSGEKFFKGTNHNIFSKHNSSVGSLINFDNKIVSSSSEGKIISWDPADTMANVLMQNLPTIRELFIANSSLMCLTNGSIIEVTAGISEGDVFNFPLYSINDVVYTAGERYIITQLNKLVITDDYGIEGDVFFETDARINVVEYDPESGTLIAALSDGQLLYWNDFHQGAKKPEVLVDIPDANWSTVKIFPERSFIAAGTGNSQGAVYIWDLKSGEELNSLRGHNARVTGIVFSHDAKLMATSSYDGSVNLWRLDDLNTLPVKFDDHEAWVTSLAFTNNDQFIISGDRDGNLRKLPTDINIMLDDYCKYISRTLTESEWQNYVGQDVDYKPTKCTD
ncbi:MAG TPA: hypothetical protein VJ951_00975, partial [Bacteroidales bacterium]|nr:hypothetical protein [Bacteroidales bacterium]